MDTGLTTTKWLELVNFSKAALIEQTGANTKHLRC